MNCMDFEKVLSLRQAVRAYTDEQVSEEQLKAILNAAYRAPVGMHNFAGYHLTVITRPELLALMVDTARKVTGKDNNPLYGAPAFILVSATKDAIQKIVGQDAGCIMENMHLKAADLHLGAVYIFGMVNAIKGEKEWQKMAELPEGAVPICGLAVGHAAELLEERQIQPVFATNFVK